MSTLEIQEAEAVKLPLAEIKVDPELQCRARGIVAELVRQYAEVMREVGPDHFPKVIVFQDGKGTYWLADGFHRYAALASIDMTASIKVEIHEGSRKDALLYAAGANAEHGRARTPADKHKAVMALLAEPAWAKRADNWIAKHAKVSHTFVAKLRSTCNDASGGVRETADGRTMDTSNIGSRKPGAGAVELAMSKFRSVLALVPEGERARFAEMVLAMLAEEAAP